MSAWFSFGKKHLADGSSLPLLDYTAGLFENLDFSDTLFVGCIHLLKANVFLVKKLIELGMKPADILVLGKVYSTSKKSAEEISRLGVYIHPASQTFESHRPFDEVHYQAIGELIERAKSQIAGGSYKKVVVVDDGGHMLEKVLDHSFGKVEIKGVEWTSSGYNLLKNLKISFPVVNMARSRAKLSLESPMIAEAAVQWLKKFFGLFNRRVNKILVIGGGAIGSSIAAELKGEHDVQIYDLVPDYSDFDKEKLIHILGSYDMVIGTTGKRILKANDFKRLKRNVILASASSSDREFSAVELRKRAVPAKDPHQTIAVDGITLLNCGFPIPFDGSEAPVDLGKIQLTVSLAFASIAQTSTARGEGFVELKAETQQAIIDRFITLRS